MQTGLYVLVKWVVCSPVKIKGSKISIPDYFWKSPISNVESETGQSFGLYTVNKNLNSNNLSISNVKGREFSSAIATTNTTLNVDNLQIYNPSTLNKSSEKRHLAIYSKNSSINVKEAIIDGDIIANNSNLKLGKPSTNSKIHSDLFALNNSVINIDLNI